MTDPTFKPSAFFYSAFLLSYLIENDLNNARFLWKRISTDVKKNNPAIGTVWRIGQHMWQHEYEETYKAIHSTQWDASVQPLVVRMIESFRQRTAMLLTRAYTSISSTDAASFLGLTEDDTQRYVQQLHWSFDTNTRFYTPNKDFLVAQQVQQQRQSGLQTLQGLADKTVFLEIN
jgi:COP9 signalosome complex subunit 8